MRVIKRGVRSVHIYRFTRRVGRETWFLLFISHKAVWSLSLPSFVFSKPFGMANPNEHVPLPDSVEHLLGSICRDQDQPPPDSYVRRQLANIGEESALDILNQISMSTIRSSLSGFIMCLIRSPNKFISLSPNAPKRHTARLMNTQVTVCATANHFRIEDHPGSTSPLRDRGGAELSMSPELVALGELEFRKAFLLLSYIGGESLEQAMTAEKIRSLKASPMWKFEEEAWEAVGKKYISEPCERRQSLDWESGKPYVYHCVISPDGSTRFKGPFLDETRTHLQKSLGDDNVIIVKFAEKSGSSQRMSVEEAYALYSKFGKEGIRVGLRLYHFFVFKDGKEEKKKDSTTSAVKCYFVRTESRASVDERESYKLSGKSMFEARSLFMHAHTLTSLDKFMARFSLILSKTLTLDVDLATVHVELIEDVNCQDENGEFVHFNGKKQIHTDGTGFISEDLAALCPRNLSKGRPVKAKSLKGISNLVGYDNTTVGIEKAESITCEPPLLIQCRIFHKGQAIKGTLLINKKLPPQTIQVRPSMVKVPKDRNLLMQLQSINSMEIVSTSNKPQRAYLSRNLIALLSYGGVPNEFFMDSLKSALEDAYSVFTNKRAALRVSVSHGEFDGEFTSARMILSGIPLDEAYLQYRLSVLATTQMRSLKMGKFHIPDCYYVMGTADPTGCLKKDQVCIIHENGQVSGDVLVYHHPGLHFGDIHILQATYVKELESFVGHSKYGIFFPCVGPRSLADEMAGADFDGDMYWVSQNPQLLKYFKKSDPYIENPPCNDIIDSKQPSALTSDELQDELFKLYLRSRFQPSYAVGVAADSWIALMDRLLALRDDCPIEKQKKESLKEYMHKLIDIYYYALDAPKKGGKIEVPDYLKAEMFPHYMENKEEIYNSTSILGLIYDEVNKYQSQDISRKDIVKLPCFDVEIPKSCLNKWKSYYEEYRKDMAAALNGGDPATRSEAPDRVIDKYKEKLYGASELENSPKPIEEVYCEALAVYHLVYDYAKSKNEVPKCGFAWKVAGSALLKLYASKQGERTFTCVPSVLREIFG